MSQDEGGPLFAQDEHQVTEHPSLASVKEALLKDKNSSNGAFPPITREGNRSTSILIRGVQRRVEIGLEPNAEANRPNGLYGNNFMQASQEVIEVATRIISPPSISNIIAMAAIGYIHGQYTHGQISTLIGTAFSAFSAAIVESKQKFNEDHRDGRPKVIIHTGYWGCGAFGGNQIVMALIQLMAAHLCGIDELVFYTMTKENAQSYDEALIVYQDLISNGTSVSKAMEEIVKRGFEWGTTNGT
eukprot:TRINITY_DN869_c0_g1_i2.p1 TRINITY_DN869_c0_g1~~TRINITY_DN869_c0_g1_i2.p1  ORF type:complete len:244 (+),score=63.28 TRINITY_DN869_c0_g1_i2:344-1075(+)